MLEQVRQSFERGLNNLETGRRYVGLCQNDIQFVPAFCTVEGGFQSDAPDCFGLYAVAHAIRWSHNCANFLAAASLVSLSRLNAPAVLLGYASAFQSLHAYLALNGCVVIDRARVTGDFKTSKRNALLAIAGRLEDNDRWMFTKIPLSHSSRWRELRHVWRTNNVTRPSAFDVLFSYLWRGRWKVTPTLDRLATQMQGDDDGQLAIPWTIEERMDDFLSEIAEMRHEAQYTGFGADAEAFDAMLNREAGSYPLHLRAEAMITFASSFAIDVVNDLVEFVESISRSELARDTLRSLAFFPVHDFPQSRQVIQPVLRVALVRLDEWFLRTTG